MTHDSTTARALVLENFGKPFVLREFPLPKPAEGETLVRITAAGICGSDLHIRSGLDPRTPLPIILGHEGVGEVVNAGEGATLHDGREIVPGMPIVWERSLTCGKCFFCLKGERHLCVERKVYGINISSTDAPHLSGSYATHILLRKGTIIYPIDPALDPGVLVSATCSGATAAHAHERSGISKGCTVVIYGTGPLAAYQIAFAVDAGAKWVVAITRSPGPKADIAKEFGADDVLYRSEMDSCRIINYMLYQTGRVGADVVIDTTPDPSTFAEAVQILRRGGTYLNPGLGIPAGAVPIDLHFDVVIRNLSIQGVWTSGTRHLSRALEIVRTGRFPFDRLVTHRLPLEKHGEAWDLLTSRMAMKIVFEPVRRD